MVRHLCGQIEYCCRLIPVLNRWGRTGSTGRAGIQLFPFLLLFFVLLISYPIQGQTKKKAQIDPPPTQEELRLNRLAKLLRKQGNILLIYARELRADGKREIALDRLNDFLILYPEHPWRLNALIEAGNILKELTRFEEAVKKFTLAYRSFPHQQRSALAYLTAGKIMAEVGKISAAMTILDELIRVFPASRVGHLARIERDSWQLLEQSRNSGLNRKKTGSMQLPPVSKQSKKIEAKDQDK